MNILDNISCIEFDKNKDKIFGIKSGILWGVKKDEAVAFPILYISKPKHISDEDYQILLDNINISINNVNNSKC